MDTLLVRIVLDWSRLWRHYPLCFIPLRRANRPPCSYPRDSMWSKLSARRSRQRRNNEGMARDLPLLLPFPVGFQSTWSNGPRGMCLRGRGGGEWLVKLGARGVCLREGGLFGKKCGEREVDVQTKSIIRPARNGKVGRRYVIGRSRDCVPLFLEG